MFFRFPEDARWSTAGAEPTDPLAPRSDAGRPRWTGLQKRPDADRRYLH
jgi:hypothetical protein